MEGLVVLFFTKVYATEIRWLPIVVLVLLGLYLKSPRPAPQAPSVETNNKILPTHTMATPVPQQVLLTAENHPKDSKHLYLKIVGVNDGDTITGLDEDQTQFRIRLDAIDAPELGVPFGQASRKSLSDKVFGKQVEIFVKTKDR